MSKSFVPTRLAGDPLECDPDRLLVTLTRPDGTKTKVRVDMEQFGRLLELANGEFGDRSIVLDGPQLTVVDSRKR